MEKTIIKLNRHTQFELNGNTYNGVNELLPVSCESLCMDDHCFDIYQDKFGSHILRYRKLFPCFDASDRLFENRYFRRYMVCFSLEEAIAKYGLIAQQQISLNISKDIPSQIAPIIIADDEIPEIEIITSGQN